MVAGPLVQHLRGSLRVKMGEMLWFGDQHRRRYQVRLDSIELNRITGDIVDVCVEPKNSAVPVTVAHAMIKAHRMSWMFQKTTELGVTDVVPLITDRTVVHAKASQHKQMIARWQRIALEAAQQTERWDIPTVYPPRALNSFLDGSVDNDLKLLLWEKKSLLAMIRPWRTFMKLQVPQHFRDYVTKCNNMGMSLLSLPDLQPSAQI